MMITKKIRLAPDSIGEDRLSSLPDELIHHILSFSNVKVAVQTSVFSKRWKLIWTTLPYLNFLPTNYTTSTKRRNTFIDTFLSRRNNESQILYCDLCCRYNPSPRLFHKVVDYAISHNIQHLSLQIVGLAYDGVKLSTLASTSLNKLELSLDSSKLLKSHCWNLPALTTLRLTGSFRKSTFPRTYLECLPSLRTLVLESFELPNRICLPALTTLYLRSCQLPSKDCEFPALSTLTLEDVVFPETMTQFLPALVKLRNLIIIFWTKIIANRYVNCPQLLNLKIVFYTNTVTSHSGQIIVLGPKIRNFSSVGFFPITFAVSQLKNVNVKLRGSITVEPWEKFKKYYRQVTHMFRGLGSAKILTLDLETVEALSSVSNYFVRFSSPFYNLKYVKVPEGYEESSIPPCLKFYLLGGSPKATIVTTFPQDKLVPPKLPVCLASQKLLPGAGNDLESSSREATDFGLWQGHEVNSEFLGLLDCIVKRYPKTFDYFTASSRKLCTIKLNILCTTVKAFIETSISEVDTETIVEYRALFADLRRSFNVNWLVERLNYIEQLQFSQPLLYKLHALDSRIDDTRSKLKNMHDLRTRTTREAHKDVGTMGTNLAIRYIGDDIFSGP